MLFRSILLYPNENKICIPLILRSSYNGAHSGQISFPGGKSEHNESAESTAVRETKEEIGVEPESIELIGQLSPQFVLPSNFLVQPVVGVTFSKPQFSPDKREVVEVIEFEVSSMFQAGSIRKDIIQVGTYVLNAPFFNSGGKKIWGATAMMLNEFRILLQDWK